ncbi:integrase [Gossypium australe]|uniref:Integrase n=1 Tax=Gossypium australe TaxID=47621 RepID=A0A5B6VFN1_9ROSI|nr:integrase [Gossypium australe]
MEIVSGLPLTLRKKDVIWVVVDRLTKYVYFIPVRSDYSLDRLAELYISEIVRLHGVLLFVVSDRESKIYIAILEEIARSYIFSRASKWHHMKLCIDANAVHFYIGLSSVRISYTELIW